MSDSRVAGLDEAWSEVRQNLRWRRAALDVRGEAGDAGSMNVEHIRARLRDTFRPFAVVTSSGNKYGVPHPDFIFVTDRTVIVADEQGYTTSLDPLHIVGLEDLRPRRNGSGKDRPKR